MNRTILSTFLMSILFGIALMVAYPDIVFRWDYADPVGPFIYEKDETVDAKVDPYLENVSGKTCVHKWLGRDDQYVYTYALCGKFAQDGDKVTFSDGFSSPTRLEIDKATGEIIAFKQPDPQNYEESHRNLLPKFVHAMGNPKGRELDVLLQAGLQRQSM